MRHKLRGDVFALMEDAADGRYAGAWLGRALRAAAPLEQ